MTMCINQHNVEFPINTVYHMSMSESVHKIVGYVSVILGSIATVLILLFTMAIQPRMAALTLELEQENRLLMPTLVVSYVSLALGILNTYIGVKLLSNKEKDKNKLTKVGILLCLLIILCGGGVLSFLVASTLTPIYSVTSNF